MSLAANLKKHRVRKGKSLQEVADAVGVSKPHIWKLEKEPKANPSLELLAKLALYYETSVSTLIGEKEGLMVFGREFDPDKVDAETQKYVIELAEKLIGKNNAE